MDTVIGLGMAQIGKMGMTLRDSHLNTKIKRCLLETVIVPELEYAGKIWKGNAKSVKQMGTEQIATAHKKLGYSDMTSYTVLRVELGMHPLETDIPLRK